MNFVLTAHVGRLAYPEGVAPESFRLIVPFTRDPSKWLRMKWTDVAFGSGLRHNH
ncbi:MAG: hypothetical protein ACREQX_16795 [Candidatus Binataceae bacterium]